VRTADHAYPFPYQSASPGRPAQLCRGILRIMTPTSPFRVSHSFTP
jgi:hypothetical protein